MSMMQSLRSGTRVLGQGLASIGQGMADIVGSYSGGTAPAIEPPRIKLPQEGIAEDWNAVGGDLRTVMGDFDVAARKIMEKSKEKQNC